MQIPKAFKYPLPSSRIYKEIISLNFPEGYQILCFNCNYARFKYGTCPHQYEKGSL